jgi:hypothetical protein
LAFVSAVATAAVVGVFTAGSASAATSVFCTDSASDQATLQNAIDGGGTVLVHGACLGNWTIANQVTLTGVGGAKLLGAGAGPVLSIDTTSTVTINTLTISGGNGDFGGGVDVFAFSTVFIDNSKIVGNTSDEEGGGLAADFDSFVSLTGTSVTGNFASFAGGGIAAFEAFLTLTNSSVSSNTVGTSEDFGEGGGISGEGASISLTGSRVVSNVASAEGGGIANFDGGLLGEAAAVQAHAMPAMTVGPHHWLRPNLASGQVARGNARPNQVVVLPPVGLTLTNSTVDHNQAGEPGAGGIINLAGEFDSPATITNSAITNNTASGPFAIGGGGLVNVAGPDLLSQMTIVGSQFRGNLARKGNGLGGGIYNEGDPGGAALVSLSSTSVSQAAGTLNPNQAAFGGGIYNTQFSDDVNGDGVADVSLQNRSSVVRNQALLTGGGVLNDCGATFSMAPGSTVMLNVPNNIVNNPGPFDILGDDCFFED